MKNKEKTLHYNIYNKISALLKGEIPEHIDTSSFTDEDEIQYAQLINRLIGSISEIHNFIFPLSRGELHKNIPKTNNYLCSPFKELQSKLLHLTWQTEQIAKGDYSQRVDFMGDFSTAFNFMINKLAENEKALKEKIDLLAERTRELEEKNEEMEKFVYTVSHDLKSPLLTISGFTEMMEIDAAGGDSERLKKDAQYIHNAVDKMNNLLEKLLELSRIGRVVNIPEKVSLNTLAQEAANLVSGQIVKSCVRIEILPNLPVVFVDKQRFIQVMQNLIDNAIKYMGDQTNPRIEIGATNNKSEIICYVKDNGGGIDPRYHEKIFNLFERYDEKSTGSGIGLASVKKIIEIHDGRIWVESEGKGKGSIFYFTIPNKETDGTTIIP
ncbi:MAG: HAMP domain-containing histidine kinase [Planctomycetes bacterium]|nr:HAMP domain-containing histidine kinase [Planctomycetota bacterium]